jgi:uncharacterized SAM-binding protein YcdF (DUF218 family)
LAKDHPDLLIILGRGFRRGTRHGQPQLTAESKMGVLAAVEIIRRKVTVTILLSGGRTAGPEHASEALAMRAYLKAKLPGFPDEAIFLEEESLDTAGNAAKVSAMLAGHCACRPALLLTGKMHLPRARRLFQAHGLAVEGIPVEHELGRRSPHYHRLVDVLQRSPRALLAQVREILLRSLLLLDAKGRMIHRIAARLRKPQNGT